MPTKFVVIFMSGVSSYGNANAEIILVKVRQGVKNIKKKKKVSTQRTYLEERKKRRHWSFTLGKKYLAWNLKGQNEHLASFYRLERADRQGGWGIGTKDTRLFFLTWSKSSSLSLSVLPTCFWAESWCHIGACYKDQWRKVIL